MFLHLALSERDKLTDVFSRRVSEIDHDVRVDVGDLRITVPVALQSDLVDQEAFKKLFKLDDWNDVVIIAKGNHIQHYLNNTLILDFTDNHPEFALAEGILALQLHAGKPMWAEFKNIRIREIK